MKSFTIKHNIGSAKDLVLYYNGEKIHKDGSDFFDIKVFKNKKKMNYWYRMYTPEAGSDLIAVMGDQVGIAYNPPMKYKEIIITPKGEIFDGEKIIGKASFLWNDIEFDFESGKKYLLSIVGDAYVPVYTIISMDKEK